MITRWTKEEWEFVKKRIDKKMHPKDIYQEHQEARKDKGFPFRGVEAIARQLSKAGISYAGWLTKAQREKQGEELYREADQEGNEKFDVSKSSGGLEATVNIKTKAGEKVTFQEILKNPKFTRIVDAGEIDLDNYHIDRFITNSWDITNRYGETFTNHQFKIWWKLNKPEPLEIAIKDIEKNISKVKKPKVKAVKKKRGNRMVEVALYDIHFASLAWGRETGQDYDLKIARKVYINAINQLVSRIQGMKIDYFLFPIGNDFLHINDLSNLTPTNRNPLDVDSRLAQIIEESEYMLINSIEQLKEIAPVKIFWVPGNHDPQTSFYLLRILNAWYSVDDRVDIDTSPQPRKYKVYGKNLIGFLHGCGLARNKRKQLPGLMADEVPNLWKPNQYREIHMGHVHKKNELIFNAASTHGSVVVRVIPSITGTDAWHFSKGFVKTSKTAQFFVWHKNYGLESIQDIHIPESIYKQSQKIKGDRP